jgi:hypothetical protein
VCVCMRECVCSFAFASARTPKRRWRRQRAAVGAPPYFPGQPASRPTTKEHPPNTTHPPPPGCRPRKAAAGQAGPLIPASLSAPCRLTPAPKPSARRRPQQPRGRSAGGGAALRIRLRRRAAGPEARQAAGARELRPEVCRCSQKCRRIGAVGSQILCPQGRGCIARVWPQRRLAAPDLRGVLGRRKLEALRRAIGRAGTTDRWWGVS